MSKIIPGLVGFISVILFIRIFDADKYGQFSFFLSQCNLIVALCFGWLNQSQLRYFWKDSSNINYKYSQRNALVYSAIFCLLFLFLFVVFQSQSIKTYLVLLTAIISIGFFHYIKTYYQSILQPKSIVKLTAVQSLLSLFIPIGLLLFLENEGSTLLIGFGLSFLITIFIFNFKKNSFLSDIFSSNNISKNNNLLLKKWFSYGIPLSIWFAGGLTLDFLDRFFINYYLHPHDLGVYSGLQEILTRLFSLTLFPLTMSLHPRIMHSWNESKFNEAKKLIFNSILIMLGIGILIFTVFSQFNDFIILGLHKLIPQLKTQSNGIILPLLLAGFLWQISFLTHKMLELNEKTLLMIFAIIPSILINLFGNIIFVPKIGMIATSYTAFFSALSYCVFTGFYSLYLIKRKKAD